MAEECLQNSVKHGTSKNILVNFIHENGLLKFLIEDDGKGFTHSKKGFRTQNIASQIERLGRTWKVNSIPGKGTKVILQIPMDITYHLKQRLLGKKRSLLKVKN